MKKSILLCGLLLSSLTVMAQRTTDVLDRGLVVVPAQSGGGNFVSWRIQSDEYYDVTYNVYSNGTLIAKDLKTSNYSDKSGSASTTYQIAAVVRGVEKEKCTAVQRWSSSYKEIKLTHEGIKSTLVPNDACCADVDGDGELEILMKFDNNDEVTQSYPKLGPVVDGVSTGEYSIFEVLKQDGTRLWWVNCGPNMGDFQNNEQNIVAYDWDGDGKAEAVMRAADGTTIHMADGTTYVVGDASKNYRSATGGGTNWFMHEGSEYLVYMDGETGKPYQCIEYPLKRLESGETDLNKAWGDGYGHRSTKHFFGAPYLDGRKPSIFLARGIYTRHKMIAYDVDPTTHTLKTRWTWYNNTSGPWYGQGYHNFGIADVDWDGRDEIVFGSMVIDDNGKGLSTTGLGHGDAQHCGDFNPYIHGQEIYACNEDQPGNNYRDATTSKIYHRFESSNDDGRAMCGNFSNAYPGGIGCSAREGAISTITGTTPSDMSATGINTNFRIYWDGDLCEETFNYLNGKNTEGCIAKYGSWSPIYTCVGSLTNNDTKGTPCYQGDILGDWREEIIMRTADNNIRIYTTPVPTEYRNYSLWYDHQYRNAMVWQMCGYNQPPHTSYFLGEMEGITVAPPPLTMTGREEVANGGTVSSSLNDKHVIVCETGNSTISLEEGAKPYILTINVPTWVQGTASSESTASNPTIKYTTYTCDVTAGSLAGEARLVKQGDGILNLPATDFTNTGSTDVWAGTINFDGTMKNSDVWLNRFAELNSNGGAFKSITADYASIIRPGGATKVGTITTDSLNLGFGSRIVVDLNGSDLTADCMNTKYLSIEKKTGTAWTKYGPGYVAPVIELNAIGSVEAGKYIIGTVSDKVEGDVSDITLEGLSGEKKALYLEGNNLVLEISGMRDATAVTWTGANDGTWDLAETENFVMSDNSTSVFVSQDDVTFGDDATNKTVTVTGEVQPNTFTVNNTSAAYTFKGTGAIIGDAQFIKEGTGTVTMSGENSYTGGNYIKGGTVKVSKLSNQYSATGALGGITTAAAKFTIENGAVLQTTADVEMGSPITLKGDDGGVINNSGAFDMDKSFYGTQLTKKGSGCLSLNASNSVSKITMEAGSMALASGSAPATIELAGGILYDDAQNTSHAIIVPKGKSATWDLTYTYYTAYANKLTGEGTLTIVPRNTVQRVRITGDWSSFKGTIKHTTSSIILPLDNSTGMPNATLNVASGCSVSNVAKSFKIGKLVGTGSLIQPVSNFKSQSTVSGSNTWVVGNSSDDLGDFKFEGTIDDAGGSNKSNFEKIGSCKMTTTGVWTTTGTVKVTGGELHFNSGATLGSGALSIAAAGTLSGATKSGSPLTNSSVTVNGTLQPGSTATAYTGTMEFNDVNVTFNKNSVLVVNAKRAATASINGCATLSGIKKLTMNGVIQVNLPDSHTLVKGDSIRLWSNVTSFAGTPTFSFSSGNWDTSRISEGLLFYNGLVGDVNNDGVISVADVTTLASHILNGTTGTLDATIADVNGDGSITSADVTALADIILNGN